MTVEIELLKEKIKNELHHSGAANCEWDEGFDAALITIKKWIKKIEDESQSELEQYSRELGLSGVFSLASLIDSHRTIRQDRLDIYHERMRVQQEAVERAKAIATEEVMHGEYFSAEKLRTMTLGEISDMLYV